MSASNEITYMIERDCLSVIKGKYWYKLSHQPLMDSLTVRFDLSKGTTELRSQDVPYEYKTIETDCVLSEPDYKVYTIVSADTLPYTDNGIYYIPCTSQESVIFSRCLIGSNYQKDGKIIYITRENYTEHLERMIGLTFIDFSVSNQINQILSSNNSELVCEQVDISYFYEVIGN